MDRTHCPNCTSSKVIAIIYGEPSSELEELASRSDIILGGCLVDDSQPTYRCGECGYEGLREDGYSGIRV